MKKRKPTIVVDTYGGAAAPQGIVAAAARMARQGVARIVLVGDVARMQEHLSLLPYDPMTLRLVGAPAAYPRQLGDTAAQARAARLGLPIAMELLRTGEADALLTASPQALVLELAELHLAKLPGLTAVAAAAVFPTMPRASGDDPLALLLDVSGRRVASADELVAFAVLGSTYSRVVTGVPEPHVALLSTGADPADGPPDVVEAHQKLKKIIGLRFTGNITATDLARGHADVVVADGLVGHTVRGLLEGLTTLTVEAARYAWRTKVTWQLGLRLLDRGVGMLRKVSEFQQYGGAPVLGLQHLVLIASPDSAEVAFENAIKLATRCTHRDLQEELAQALGRVVQAADGAANV
jgi:glycerol-3-phosphate acyltransferase PlsX